MINIVYLFCMRWYHYFQIPLGGGAVRIFMKYACYRFSLFVLEAVIALYW